MNDAFEPTPKPHPVVPENRPPRDATERSSTFSSMWRRFKRSHIGFTPKQLIVGIPFLCSLGWTFSHYEREFTDTLARADRTEQLVKWQTRALKAIARHDGVQLPPMPDEEEPAAPLLSAPISMKGSP